MTSERGAVRRFLLVLLRRFLKYRQPLLTLPLELQIAILLHLELNSVLTLRRVSFFIFSEVLLTLLQVCKGLHTATLQRPVWMNILMSPPPPMNLYSFFLDKDIETSTSADIESMISHSFRQQKVWGNSTHYRRREIAKKTNRLGRGTILLVPGGRWMITFTDPGGAIATDLLALDKPTIDLFPPTDPSGPFPTTIQAAIQTQEAGVQTEFKIFVMSVYPSENAKIQVWLVRPTYDGTGRVDGLTSKLVSSFAGGSGPFVDGCMSLSISGLYIGYLSYYNYEGDLAAVVIDWTEANGQEDFDKIPKHVVLDLFDGDVSILILYVRNIF